MMRTLLAALAVLALAMSFGCNGGTSAPTEQPDITEGVVDQTAGPGEGVAEPTQPPQPGQSPEASTEDLSSREDDLRDTAAEAMEAFINGDNAKFYTYFSSGFRERCPLGDFIGLLALAQGFLGDMSDAEVAVGDIRFETDRAFVDVHLVLAGQELEPDGEDEEYPDYWILEDGEWKTTTDDPRPCTMDQGGEGPETEDEGLALRSVGISEGFTVDAQALAELLGEGSLSGSILVRVTDSEARPSIHSDFYGQQDARGKFVVIYYEVESDLNRRMQPATQINDQLTLMDDRGRQWESADYQGDYFGISGDAAEARGCDEPAAWIGAGFMGCTAVVFDVPKDASGFTLRWQEAGVSIALGL
jgi:hypothetical protein